MNSGKYLSETAANAKGANTVKNTPIMLLPRAALPAWQPLPTDPASLALSHHGRRLHELLQQRGALFFDEIRDALGLLPVQCEQTLAELVGAGIVSCDGFSGLRALIATAKRSHSRRRRPANSLEDAGRWSLVNKPPGANHPPNTDAVEHIVRALLKRYGVIVRKVLERETLLPGWRELLYVLHRMEARGEILGGRFVSGFAGEQFALPEAASTLRQIAGQPTTHCLISIAATDPLNLTAVLTPGRRVPALRTHRILFRDGVPIGYSRRDQVHFFDEIDAREAWEARNALLRQTRPLHYHRVDKPPVQ